MEPLDLFEEADPTSDWTEAIVVPRLYALLQRPASRERSLALHMVQVLVALRVVSGEVALGVLLPLLLNAADDVVANVRLAVAKTLEYLVSWALELQREAARASKRLLLSSGDGEKADGETVGSASSEDREESGDSASGEREQILAFMHDQGQRELLPNPWLIVRMR